MFIYSFICLFQSIETVDTISHFLCYPHDTRNSSKPRRVWTFPPKTLIFFVAFSPRIYFLSHKKRDMMTAYIQICILLNAYCIYLRIGPITAIVYGNCLNTQGYPQRMRIYTICILIFTIPCNCKRVCFHVKSLNKPSDNYI